MIKRESARKWNCKVCCRDGKYLWVRNVRQFFSSKIEKRNRTGPHCFECCHVCVCILNGIAHISDISISPEMFERRDNSIRCVGKVCDTFNSYSPHPFTSHLVYVLFFRIRAFFVSTPLCALLFSFDTFGFCHFLYHFFLLSSQFCSNPTLLLYSSTTEYQKKNFPTLFSIFNLVSARKYVHLEFELTEWCLSLKYSDTRVDECCPLLCTISISKILANTHTIDLSIKVIQLRHFIEYERSLNMSGKLITRTFWYFWK